MRASGLLRKCAFSNDGSFQMKKWFWIAVGLSVVAGVDLLIAALIWWILK